MKRIRARLATLIIGLLVSGSLASAHHVIVAKFDPGKPVTLRGIVSKVDWLNPHAHIFIDVQEGPKITTWAIELESQVDLQRSGWTRETLKIGDAVVVARDICQGRK